jgi:hypothetical protein
MVDIMPILEKIILSNAVIDKTASAEAPPKSSWFEHG